MSDAPTARSRGREVTYQVNLQNWDQVRAEVVRLAELSPQTWWRRTGRAVRVVVKVRYAPFFTSSHSLLLPGPTAEGDAIPEAALAALERFTDRRAGPAAGGPGRVR